MKSLISFVCGSLFVCILFSCKRSSADGSGLVFDSIPQVRLLQPQLNEVSGMADSKLHDGYIWLQEDSGNPQQLHLYKHDGTLYKKFWVKGAANRDWEDMTIANNEIYLAETGDNNQVYNTYAFYHFPEPALISDTIQSVDTVRFTYADGPHDSEAFLVDNDRSIYVITKRDAVAKIYRIAFPYQNPSVAVMVGTLPFTNVVSAAQSPDGAMILVRTYGAIYLYKRTSAHSLLQALTTTGELVSHRPELQGESISFARDGSGFYTGSEKFGGTPVDIKFYRKL